MKLIYLIFFFLIILGCSNERPSEVSIGSIELENGDATDLNFNVLYINAQVDCDLPDSVNTPIWFRSKRNLIYPKCPIFEFDSINEILKLNGIKYLDSSFDLKKLNTIVFIDYRGNLQNCNFPDENSVANGYLYANDTLTIRTIVPSTSGIAFKLITSSQEIFIEQSLDSITANKIQIHYPNSTTLDDETRKIPDETYSYRYYNNIETVIRTNNNCH